MLGNGFCNTSFRSLASRFVAEIVVGIVAAIAASFVVEEPPLLLYVVHDDIADSFDD